MSPSTEAGEASLSRGCGTSIVVGVVVALALFFLGERQGLSSGALLLASPGGAIATTALLVVLGERRWEELLSAWVLSLSVSLVPISFLTFLVWLGEMGSD